MTKYSTNSVLTLEIFNKCLEKTSNTFGQPDAFYISPSIHQQLLKMQALEKEWSKYPPHIRKQLKLKHYLKAKWSVKREIKQLPLPK